MMNLDADRGTSRQSDKAAVAAGHQPFLLFHLMLVGKAEPQKA